MKFFNFEEFNIEIARKVLFSVALFQDYSPEKLFHLGEQIKRKMIRYFMTGIMFFKTTDDS